MRTASQREIHSDTRGSFFKRFASIFYKPLIRCDLSGEKTNTPLGSTSSSCLVPLITSVVNCPPDLVNEFQSAINGLAVEKRGIGHMEMFFVYALAVAVRPRQIIESGRARGQSTIVLARCFLIVKS